LDRLRELWIQLSDTRYAARESRLALRVYERVRREHPEISGRALYIEVVRNCTTGASERIEELVRHAEESFADWPEIRDLQFRDVVSYIVFDELVVSKNRQSTSADIQAAVSKIIPADL
jgi:hypothetical protein